MFVTLVAYIFNCSLYSYYQTKHHLSDFDTDYSCWVGNSHTGKPLHCDALNEGVPRSLPYTLLLFRPWLLYVVNM